MFNLEFRKSQFRIFTIDESIFINNGVDVNSTFRKNQSHLNTKFRRILHIEEETTRFLIKPNKQDKNKFDIDIMLYREFLNKLIEENSPSLTNAFMKAKKGLMKNTQITKDLPIVKIIILTVADINGVGLDVEMMRQISMVFAERERKVTALRTKEGIRGKVATEQYPYHAPIGYKNIIRKGSKYKEMVIDEENAFFVKQAYTMCLQGDSIVTITKKLYNMGFRNKNGNKHPKSTVEYILHNIAYIGKFYYDDILVEYTVYPPLLDEVTYYAVQDRLNEPNKTRQNHTEFPYNKCITCAKCGCMLTGERHKKLTKKEDNKNRVFELFL